MWLHSLRLLRDLNHTDVDVSMCQCHLPYVQIISQYKIIIDHISPNLIYIYNFFSQFVPGISWFDFVLPRPRRPQLGVKLRLRV